MTLVKPVFCAGLETSMTRITRQDISRNRMRGGKRINVLSLAWLISETNTCKLIADVKGHRTGRFLFTSRNYRRARRKNVHFDDD